jgi:hypothetical protein
MTEARLLTLIALACVSIHARGENPGSLKQVEFDLPVARQEMWGLKHRYYDPETGALRYEVTAAYGTTRVEESAAFFDVTKPELVYHDREKMTFTSAKGVIHLKKGEEKVVLNEGVIGYLDTAKTAKFVTDALEVDFEGNGQSDRPIRFTRDAMLLFGRRSVFFRVPLPAAEDTKRKGKVAKVVVYGPGYACFRKEEASAGGPNSTTHEGAQFVVEFNGTASYSQLQPVLYFTADVDSESDRVVLYGDGYVLKCMELQMRATPDVKSWDTAMAKRDVRYEVRPGAKAADRLKELERLAGP